MRGWVLMQIYLVDKNHSRHHPLHGIAAGSLCV